MADQQHSPDSTGKNFFSTLPGIITAIAGLITAIGGFILILNKAGCMAPKTGEANEQQVAPNNIEVSETTGNPDSTQATTHTGQNVSYSPSEIKVSLKAVVFKITSANIETLPNKEIVLNVKVKCVNESKYEYHFYAYNMRVKIGEDKYASDPLSPSDNYQAVDGFSFKNLEYNFKLPAGTKKFNLVVYDEKDEMGSAAFTVK